MRTIAIINQKGGCGKTTSAINLAGMLARAGKRTLLVDMDPQSHCAAGLGVPDHKIDMDIGDAMLQVGNRTIDTARLLWHAGRNLDLAPSRMKLAGLEAARGGLANLEDKERRLGLVLRELSKDYDLALIDCSPAIGLLTFNALAAADAVLIPVETSFFSLQGATRQVNTIKTLARRLQSSPAMWLLPTIHDEASPVALDLLNELRKRFSQRVAPVIIRRDPALKEAASFGQTIIDYDPNSPGAHDYGTLAAWLMKQLAEMPREQAIDLEPVIGEGLIEVIANDPSEIVPRQDDSDDERDEFADGEATGAMADASPASFVEHKPDPAPGPNVSRAEDVARRAQQFLRRLAVSNAPSAAATMAGTNDPTPAAATATAIAEPEAAPGVSTQPFLAPHPTLRVIKTPPAKPVTLDASMRALLGVRVTRQGVLFVQPMTLGRRLAVAGDFNNWSPVEHILKVNESLGVFELCVKLPPGRHRYRLVVDGKWQPDPHNDNGELNPFGEVNSILNVPTESGGAASA